jgi:hypothetical protein
MGNQKKMGFKGGNFFTQDLYVREKLTFLWEFGLDFKNLGDTAGAAISVVLAIAVL